MTQTNKFESLLELLINEENDKAEALFHEIVVEKSRDIYEGLVDSETAVEEAKDESKEEEKVEEATEETADEEVEIEETTDEEAEETNEAESIEEIGGDATDDLIADEAADEEGDADHGEEHGEEGDTEERVADLEDALDELKAEFEKMMNGDKEEGDEEESLDAMEPAQDAQAELSAEQTVESKEVVKEYKIQKSADNGDKADNKHSPVKDAGNTLPKGGDNIAKGSAEEKGGTAPTAQKIIGDVANTGGKNTQALKAAPKADTADKADNKKSPVATK